MKRISKSAQGVTLLEIMLVLAVAAMIIVMSVRYYQTATSSQQVNAVMQQIAGITAAADGLAQTSGSYSAATNSAIKQLMPNSSLVTPWGGTLTYAKTSATIYTVTITSVPSSVCPLLHSRIKATSNFTQGTCAASGASTYTYTYNSAP